jgi:hypothetical protein
MIFKNAARIFLTAAALLDAGGAFCLTGYALRCGTAAIDGVWACQFAASGDDRQFRRLGDALPPHRQHAW